MEGGLRLRLRTTAGHEDQRLDLALGQWLPGALGRPLSKSVVRRLIMAGAVAISGRPLRAPGRRLRAGLDVVVRVDPTRLPARRADEDVAFALTPADVLYEDEVLIAVDKPAGLATVPTADPARPSLVRAVAAYLGRDRPRAMAIGVHQRLDRDTSGVVLFAKDPSANPALARAFGAREVEKTYHALTARPVSAPSAPWRVVSALGAIGKGRLGRVLEGGKRGETDFVVLETLPRGLLVEARPRTGRKHQIRVHLAEGGLPILGDPVYGDRRAAPRLMLHATRLALRHPITGERLVIESPWPSSFRRAIEAMRSGSGPQPPRERAKAPVPTRRARRARKPFRSR